MNIVLSKESIKTGYSALTWQEAVAEAGRLLEKVGLIETRYIGAMIDMVMDYGAYMLVAPGVAMPHAHADKGVLKTGISFLRLSAPVYFPGKPENPILLLVAVAASGTGSHLDVMGDVAQVISDADSLAHVMQEEDPDEIYRVMNGAAAGSEPA